MSQSGFLKNSGGGGSGTVISLTGNNHLPVFPDGGGNINVYGAPGSLITTYKDLLNPNQIDIFIDNGTNGQVILGGGSAPAWATLTSTGGTITFTPGPNTLNLEATFGSWRGGVYQWFVRSSIAAITAQVNTGYISTAALGAFIDLTLPLAANAGDVIRIGNYGPGGWILHTGGQVIQAGVITVNNNVTSFTVGDVLEVVCVVPGVSWMAFERSSNLVYV